MFHKQFVEFLVAIVTAGLACLKSVYRARNERGKQAYLFKQ